MRKSKIKRETNETKVLVSINVDGIGKYSNETFGPCYGKCRQVWKYSVQINKNNHDTRSTEEETKQTLKRNKALKDCYKYILI